MSKSKEQKIDTIEAMVLYMIENQKERQLAKILVDLQEQYAEIATLSTDGSFDPSRWTHKNLLDFLTKGELTDEN